MLVPSSHDCRQSGIVVVDESAQGLVNKGIGEGCHIFSNVRKELVITDVAAFAMHFPGEETDRNRAGAPQKGASDMPHTAGAFVDNLGLQRRVEHFGLAFTRQQLHQHLSHQQSWLV
jgi:hypothetical protein